MQRTRVLIHLLDGLSEDPLADYAQINAELALFDPGLGKKPQVVALNKIDQPEVAERLESLKKDFKKKKVTLMGISGLARINVRELLLKAYGLLQEAPSPLQSEAPLPVYHPVEKDQSFEVIHEPKGWRVRSKAIERAAEMTPWDQPGSVRRFQKLMERLGVDKALTEAGAQEGDAVFIGDYELEYQE